MHGYPPGQCKRASASGSIDESVMQQTFQDIINCIDSDGGDCSSNSFRDNSSTASQTKRNDNFFQKSIFAEAAAAECGVDNTALPPPVGLDGDVGEGVNGGKKSFLDDDWLTDRMVHDEKMAKVAAGLVRPATAFTSPPDHGSDSNGLMVQTSQMKFVPPHGHRRSTSLGSNNGASSGNSAPPPPNGYLCRVCGVPGHWIEQCSSQYHQPNRSSRHRTNNYYHQQPKYGTEHRQQPPPSGYICNLCNSPSHYIYECSQFHPYTLQRRH